MCVCVCYGTMCVGSFGSARKHLKRNVSVHLCAITGCEMSARGCKVHREFMVNISPSRSPRLIHPAHTRQAGSAWLRGGNATIRMSQLSPLIYGGHRCRNEVMGAKRACWGTAGCRRVFHWLFISKVVKFIYQLWVLCFVSLLYAPYKVIINSIWEHI